jgi:hypothetical protein
LSDVMVLIFSMFRQSIIYFMMFRNWMNHIHFLYETLCKFCFIQLIL